MKRALPLAALALAAACSSEPTAPPPPPVVESATIETASVAPATAAPEPVESRAPKPEPPQQPVASALSPAQIEKTFMHHRRFFEKLFAERLQAPQPNAGGTVHVSFTIEPDGSARGASVAESTMADPAFEHAVAKQVEQMTFPPADGATPVVRYPLHFSAPAPARK